SNGQEVDQHLNFSSVRAVSEAIEFHRGTDTPSPENNQRPPRRIRLCTLYAKSSRPAVGAHSTIRFSGRGRNRISHGPRVRPMQLRETAPQRCRQQRREMTSSARAPALFARLGRDGWTRADVFSAIAEAEANGIETKGKLRNLAKILEEDAYAADSSGD